MRACYNSRWAITLISALHTRIILCLIFSTSDFLGLERKKYLMASLIRFSFYFMYFTVSLRTFDGCRVWYFDKEWAAFSIKPICLRAGVLLSWSSSSFYSGSACNSIVCFYSSSKFVSSIFKDYSWSLLWWSSVLFSSLFLGGLPLFLAGVYVGRTSWLIYA